MGIKNHYLYISLNGRYTLKLYLVTYSIAFREHPHTTSDFLGGGGVKPNLIFYMYLLIKVSDEGGVGGQKK